MGEVSQYIKQLREDFMKGSLSEQDAHSSPDMQFDAWMKAALDAGVTEAQACTLSTVSADGKPSGRIIYLREYRSHLYFFYTNYGSRKAADMNANAQVCLTFFWPELERQVRIEGTVSVASKETSDLYFKDRPRESKIGSWSSPQSHVLKNRAELENFVTSNTEKFSGADDIPRPEFWGGYVITASYYEFWQGRKSRLHDRICYTKEGETWKTERLAP